VEDDNAETAVADAKFTETKEREPDWREKPDMNFDVVDTEVSSAAAAYHDKQWLPRDLPR
jgi:hypothetical protein